MTITHEPAHVVRRPRPREAAPRDEPRADVYLPRHDIRVDTSFWQHRSIFAGSQEQLDQLRREADARATARARAEEDRTMRAAHRPVFKRLKPVVHVGFVPLLWAITTCQCGQRWLCNDIKQYLRRRLGWTVDITGHLKRLTDDLPRPATRWTRLRHLLSRWRNLAGRPTVR